MSSRRAVFMDRDGVLNRNVCDPATGRYGAPLHPEDFKLTAGVIPALQSLRDAAFLLFLVSNQPNYAKGKISREELAAIHERLVAELRAAEVEFSEFYYCYHHPHGVVAGYSGVCDCRKPSPYFLRKAREAFGISMESSWMVGDRAVDVECGHAAGVRTIRVREDHPAARSTGEVAADFEVDNFGEAVRIILGANG